MRWIKDSQIGMSYQNFSVIPLTPHTEATRHRIEQLREDLVFVKNKSVLDIGCHAGLATLIALECGAKRVFATDICDDYLGSIQTFAEQEGLMVQTENINFLGLSERHASDVVLLLEVYHWLAKQSVTPDDVVKKLIDLAHESVFIESPVDRSDPSVTRAFGSELKDYKFFQVLDIMANVGWKIEFVGLTKYFPEEYLRGRFLLTRK